MKELQNIIKETMYDMIGLVKDSLKMKIMEAAIKGVSEEKRNKAILYTSSYCPECERIKDKIPLIKRYFKHKGYDFEVKVLDDEKSIEEALNTGIEDIPIILIQEGEKRRLVHPNEIILEAIKIFEYISEKE